MSETTTTAPDWQKGYPIERLKALAEPFKLRHKSLVFGAFGLLKERDVADALAANRLVWVGGEFKTDAVAIAYQLQRASEQQDFAQRTFTIPDGAAYVKALAARTTDDALRVLRGLEKRAAGKPIVIEIFEEDATAREAVGIMGWRHVATKIAAGSEIKGVYSSDPNVPSTVQLPMLPPADTATLEVLDPAYFNEAALSAVRKELERYGAGAFAQHYSDYNKRKSWTSFALRGYSDDPTFIIKPGEMSKSWKDENAALLQAKARWTKAAAHFPRTMALIARVGALAGHSVDEAFDRVRFMRLRSKDGELTRHADVTDREAGTADGFLCRLHIPIITSERVHFIAWTARGDRLVRNLPAGALCYLDQRKPHAVQNQGATDRTHLVMDCWANASLREQIADAAFARESSKGRPFPVPDMPARPRSAAAGKR